MMDFLNQYLTGSSAFIVGLGFFVGTVLGATGAGGAILTVPILTLILHLTVNQAMPIGLTAVALAASIVMLLGLREGIVRYKAAALMAGLGLVMSPIGFWLAKRIPNTPLVLLFAGILVYVAWHMWTANPPLTTTQPKNQETSSMELAGNVQASEFPCIQSPESGKFIWTLPCARALASIGALAGFLSGLIGVGGGFIIVPALKKFTNLSMPSVVATSLTVVTLVSSGSVAVAVMGGDFKWAIAIPFSLGTVAGMLLGRSVGKGLPSWALSRAFAVLAALAASSMLLKLAF